MNSQSPELSADEIGNRGDEIYDRLIRPSLAAKNMGRIIAIDICSEDFEIGDDPGLVIDRLKQRRPNAIFSAMRIGGGGVYTIGLIPRGDYHDSRPSESEPGGGDPTIGVRFNESDRLH